MVKMHRGLRLLINRASNEAGAVDGGIPFLLAFELTRPATTDPRCWAAVTYRRRSTCKDYAPVAIE